MRRFMTSTRASKYSNISCESLLSTTQAVRAAIFTSPHLFNSSKVNLLHLQKHPTKLLRPTCVGITSGSVLHSEPIRTRTKHLVLARLLIQRSAGKKRAHSSNVVRTGAWQRTTIRNNYRDRKD